MRINYLSLLDPFFYNGGGEMTWRSAIDVGVNRGHEIKLSYILPKLKIDFYDSPDLFIVTNLYNHGKTRRPRMLRPFFPGKIIGEIVSSAKYIHVDSAYCDVCDQGYLPCNGKVEGSDCPYIHGLTVLVRGKRCFRKFTEHIYRNSRLNVFLSPLHRQTMQTLLGEEVVGRYYEQKTSIDLLKFQNQGVKRDIEYLFVGVLTEAKGLEEMRRSFGGQEIVMVGASKNRAGPGFGRWLGTLPYEKIPDLMNRAKHFVFLPRWPEPYGRVVAEAALCGCELVVNENVGATSFGLDLADSQTYQETNEAFWEEIEKL